MSPVITKANGRGSRKRRASEVSRKDQGMTAPTIPQTSEEFADFLADKSRRDAVFAPGVDPKVAADFMSGYANAMNPKLGKGGIGGDMGVLDAQAQDQMKAVLAGMLRDGAIE